MAGSYQPSPRSQTESAIRVGISSCLLGNAVRFDGGHKHDRYATGTLAAFFDFVPVCPEVELGMGTPRDPIRLQLVNNDVRLVGTRDGQDHTAAMRRYAKRRISELAELHLSGFILKKNSPSCGMERVKVYQAQGPAKRNGTGLFAAALLKAMPHLPIEEEGRLCDPRLRENWIERVFAFHALQDLWRPRWKLGDLVRFHTRYKYTLLAHDERRYRELGKLVANSRRLNRNELRSRYQALFMETLQQIATPRKNVNVLQHMLGFLKKDLDTTTKRELASLIEDYRRGIIPLIVPITLLAHYVRVLDVGYLRDQVYLNPHPKELALRNHV